MTPEPDTIKLLPEYDVLLLQEDLRTLGGDRFRRQASSKRGRIIEYNSDGWRVLSLRSQGGDPARTDPGTAGLLDYRDTSYMDEAPYIRSILASLNIPLRAVRLMSLEPGELVAEHRDGCGLAMGWVRLHIPIVTNEGAILVIGGIEHRWQPGELWYADFSRPHSVSNQGRSSRVHLVIDCYVVETLLDLFPQDLLAGIDRSDILFLRAEQPTPVFWANTLTTPIPVPGHFLQFGVSVDEFAAGSVPDYEGMLRFVEGQLSLIVGDRLQAALVHLGDLEFRVLGWTDAATIKFDSCNGTRRIRFRRRCGRDQADVVRFC